MIAGFVGNIGSGKTLSMVKKAYEEFLKGKTIYSNIHLNFDYIPYTIDDLESWAKGEKILSNIVLLMDEAHIYLDSRSSMRKRNKFVTYLMLQTRKLGCDVYFTTQFFDQIDKRLRNLTTAIVECYTKTTTVPFNSSEKIVKTLNIVHLRKTGGIVTRKYTFQSNNIFKLYNTLEIVQSD